MGRGAEVGTFEVADVSNGEDHGFTIITPNTPFEIAGASLRVRADAELDHEPQGACGQPSDDFTSGHHRPGDGTRYVISDIYAI